MKAVLKLNWSSRSQLRELIKQSLRTKRTYMPQAGLSSSLYYLLRTTP
jgi:hypothetical protein